jgi:hypothetical protein
LTESEDYDVIAITADKFQREQIVHFLAHFKDEEREESFWTERLKFWWEDNPFFSETDPRGWILVVDSQIVGFLGIIVNNYLYRNQRYKALNATTWRVKSQHRNISMALFLRFYALKDKYVLFNTSPTDNVAEVLETFKFQKMRTTYEYTFPLRQKSWINPIKIFYDIKGISQRQKLPEGNCRIVTEEDTFVVPDMTEMMSEHYLIKERSSGYLKWFCFDYERFHKTVLGYFVDDNKISSFVILDSCTKKRIRVLDYFTLDSSGKEFLSMINYACTHPEIFRHSQARYIIFRDFIEKGMLRHRALSQLKRKEEKVRHYYSLPPHLKEVHIMRTISQGDYGF